MFADEQKPKINSALSDKRAQAGGSTQQNLPEYNRLKKDLFLALSESERGEYEEKANKHNSMAQGEPDSTHIFEFVSVLHVIGVCADWGEFSETRRL